MRDLTLGQIWDTILNLWRKTYIFWKIVLCIFAVVWLTDFWLFVEPADVIRDGKHITEIAHMTMRANAFPIMFATFAYLTLYWVVREVKDDYEKVQQ